MNDSTNPSPERVELLLRSSRRGLMVVLATILVAGATIVTHVIRPAAAAGNWAADAPWIVPVVVAGVAAVGMRVRPRPVELEVLNDELRQTNLRRAQRVALIVVLAAQLPLMALALSGLQTEAAVTVMAVTTVTLGMATLIVSFLLFDRE